MLLPPRFGGDVGPGLVQGDSGSIIRASCLSSFRNGTAISQLRHTGQRPWQATGAQSCKAARSRKLRTCSRSKGGPGTNLGLRVVVGVQLGSGSAFGLECVSTWTRLGQASSGGPQSVAEGFRLWRSSAGLRSRQSSGEYCYWISPLLFYAAVPHGLGPACTAPEGVLYPLR